MYEFSVSVADAQGEAYGESRRYRTLPPQEVLDAFAAGPGLMRALKAKFAGEDDANLTVTFSAPSAADIVVDGVSYAAAQEFQEGAHDKAGSVIKGAGRAHRKMMRDQKHGSKGHGKP
jgi:hypothetical protein